MCRKTVNRTGASELLVITVPAFSSSRLSNRHGLRVVVGVASYSRDMLRATTDGVELDASPPNLLLDLYEAGTMAPRVVGLPLSRLDAWNAEKERVGLFLSPVGLGLQPLQLGPGPGIDLGASRLVNPTGKELLTVLEIFYE